MRKLKLQMQMSLDGFVAGPNGELDWMVAEDESMSAKIPDPADSCDIILMGRKMTPTSSTTGNRARPRASRKIPNNVWRNEW